MILRSQYLYFGQKGVFNTRVWVCFFIRKIGFLTSKDADFRNLPSSYTPEKYVYTRKECIQTFICSLAMLTTKVETQDREMIKAAYTMYWHMTYSRKKNICPLRHIRATCLHETWSSALPSFLAVAYQAS